MVGRRGMPPAEMSAAGTYGKDLALEVAPTQLREISVNQAKRIVPHRLEVVDPVWSRIRDEADAIVHAEPQLSSFIFANILQLNSLEAAVVQRVTSRLDHPDMPATLIAQAYSQALDSDPFISDAIRSDIAAVVDRDPAATRFIEPILYFKGFHAIETHRLAHWLWNAGRRDFALYLQSRASAVFQCDIHPGVRIGRGIFLDHATGLVVGATAEIDD